MQQASGGKSDKMRSLEDTLINLDYCGAKSHDLFIHSVKCVHDGIWTHTPQPTQPERLAVLQLDQGYTSYYIITEGILLIYSLPYQITKVEEVYLWKQL